MSDIAVKELHPTESPDLEITRSVRISLQKVNCSELYRHVEVRSWIVSRNEGPDPRIEDTIRVHGADCVGLRIGVRAVNIVTRELAISEDTERVTVRLGTKQCLGDAFKALLHLEDNQLEYVDSLDDIIRVRNGIDLIELHLTPRKLREANDVLKASDAELFPVIKRLRN